MDPELYNAARYGDVVFLQGKGEDATAATLLISQKTPKGSSVLHIAAEFNRLDFFKEAARLCPNKSSLLKHADSRGDTALHVAAKEGSVGVVNFITTGHKELLRMLNRDGNNALHLAAQYGRYEVAKSLVEADPQLSKYDNKAGQSACFMATVRNDIVMVDLLLGLKPPCSLRGDANGKTALHEAVFTSIDIMEKIVNARPELIGESDDNGWTPLHYAAACDERVGVVEFILKYDRLAAYSVGKEGESALHIAAFNGCLDIMKVLVDTHPDCWHLLNKKGQTALHAAVLGEQPDIVKYIVGFPGIVKSVDCIADNDGNTPLHLAALCKSKAMIKLLCEGKTSSERSVMLNATNKQNLTVLDICEDEFERSHDDLGADLYGAIGIPQRHERAMYQMKKIMKNGHRLRQQTRIYRQHLDSIAGEAKSGELKLIQVTAALIATVTFTAGFTLPGGYNQSGGLNEGMAVLGSDKAFQAFVIFDIIAFFSAILAVSLQFNSKRVLSQEISEMYFTTAFLCMGLAFGCGMYVVLVKSGDLALVALILPTVLSVAFFHVLNQLWEMANE